MGSNGWYLYEIVADGAAGIGTLILLAAALWFYLGTE